MQTKGILFELKYTQHPKDSIKLYLYIKGAGCKKFTIHSHCTIFLFCNQENIIIGFIDKITMGQTAFNWTLIAQNPLNSYVFTQYLIIHC